MITKELIKDEIDRISGDDLEELYRVIKEFAQSRHRTNEQTLNDFSAQTKLGRQLMQIRHALIASEKPLMTWEEIEREVAERRGGADRRNEEEDLH